MRTTGTGLWCPFRIFRGRTPEALRSGKPLILAEDCLVVALSHHVNNELDLPAPSPFQDGQELLTVQPVVAAQLDLYTAMRQQKLSAADLAARLGICEDDAAALVNLDYRTPIGEVAKALRAVGCDCDLAVAERAA